MSKLIKNKQVIKNTWTIVSDKEIKADDVNVIIPTVLYSENLSTQVKNGKIAFLLESDQSVNDLPEGFESSPLIAVNFPAFTDGRAYSIARELREIKGYTGEIRAVGDVLHDQLNAMERCGFDAFDLRDDKDEKKAINAFKDFSQKYQADLVNTKPIYQR